MMTQSINSPNNAKLTLERFKNLIAIQPNSTNETFYLVDSNWIHSLDLYLNNSESNPFPNSVFNENLIETSSVESTSTDFVRLKRGLIENRDFQLVCSLLWNSIFNQFGGGPTIARSVIESNGRLVVELYPLELKIFKSTVPSADSVKTLFISKQSNVKELKSEILKLFGMDPKFEFSLINYWGLERKEELLESDQSSLISLGLENGQELLIDTQSTKSTSSSSSSTNSSSLAAIERRKNFFQKEISTETNPGHLGLVNVGNTCFLNSAIQCLSHTPSLRSFFLNGHFENDINLVNPIGSKGEMAKTYNVLMQDLWKKTKHSALAPRGLMIQLAKSGSHFLDQQQHDSQEFICHLLDSIHEDLNRVKEKPYFKDSLPEDWEISKLALESWNRHKQRNDSIVTDLFHGMLKSTVRCCDCPRVSTSFDPFMYLSLPLSGQVNKVLTITVLIGNEAVKYGVKVEKTQRFVHVRRSLATLLNENPENLVFGLMVNHTLQRSIQDNHRVSEISENDEIVAYIIPKPSIQISLATHILIPVIHRVMKPQNLASRTQPHFQICTNFDFPSLTLLPRSLTTQQLFQEMWKILKRNLEPKSASLFDHLFVTKSDEFSMERLFHLKLTSISTGKVIEELEVDSEKNVVLNSDLIIAIEWDVHAKKKYYEPTKSIEHKSINTSLGEKMDIEKCIKLFLQEEKLTKDNAWYCSSCKDHKQAFKRFEIWQLPDFLIIQLKRFSSVHGIFTTKLSTPVQYPIEGLDLSSLINNSNSSVSNNNAIYDLYAVDCHMGSLGFGHYVSMCKHSDENRWFLYDDSNVSPINSQDQIVSDSAYLLFYQRRK